MLSRPVLDLCSQTGEVSIQPRMNEMVFVKECTKLIIHVQTKGAKVILQACCDVVLQLQHPLVSGMVQVLNSTNVLIQTSNANELSMPTVNLDNCKEISIKIPRVHCLNQLFLTNSAVVSVQVGDFTPFVLPIPQENRTTEGSEMSLLKGCPSFVASFADDMSNTSVAMKIEPAVGEGCGWATTATRKREAEERDLRAKEAIKRVVSAFLDQAERKPG